MTLVITRPNATSFNNGALTGGATAHAVLSDDSDSSYVDLDPGERSDLGFVEPTIPAGGLVISVALRVRLRKIGSSSKTLVAGINATNTGFISGEVLVTWVTPTTVTGVVFTTSEAVTELIGQTEAKLGGSTQLRVYEAYADTTYAALPVVTVTDPTGTITDEADPDVEWTEVLDSIGGAQTYYEAKIFTAAQYGAGGFDPDTSTPTYTSGEVTSAALSHTVDTPLADATYRSYVRIAQTVNGAQHWSDWDFEGFVIDVDVPANPTISVTAESGGARHLIEVTAGEGGAVTTDFIEIQGSYDGGATWRQIRTPSGDGLITPGDDAWDWEAPNGTLATYRARAIHDFDPGYSYSAWASDSDTWGSTTIWLKHPTIPGLNVGFSKARSFPSQQRPSGATVHKVLNRPDPVVIRDAGRIYENGSLTVMTEDADERDEIDAILDAGAPMLLQFPAAADEPDRWIAHVGDFDRSRIADRSWIHNRDEVIPWQQVARPSDDRLTNLGLYPALDLFPAEELLPE